MVRIWETWAKEKPVIFNRTISFSLSDTQISLEEYIQYTEKHYKSKTEEELPEYLKTQAQDEVTNFPFLPKSKCYHSGPGWSNHD